MIGMRFLTSQYQRLLSYSYQYEIYEKGFVDRRLRGRAKSVGIERNEEDITIN